MNYSEMKKNTDQSNEEFEDVDSAYSSDDNSYQLNTTTDKVRWIKACYLERMKRIPNPASTYEDLVE